MYMRSEQPGRDAVSPIGVIDALSDGFEAVASRPFLLVLPLLLDIFLWLGPRLSTAEVFQPIVAYYAQELERPGMNAAALRDVREVQENLLNAVKQFNLTALLASRPLSVPSLLGYLAPVHTPLDAPPDTIGVKTLGSAALYTAIIWLIGTFPGVFYLRHIATQSCRSWSTLSDLLGNFPAIWGRSVGYVTITAGLLFGIFLPFGILGVLLAGSGAAFMAAIVTMTGLTVCLWMLVYVLFGIHGILLNNRPLIPAISESIRIVHTNLVSTLSLFILATLLNLGLRLLWMLPNPSSWLLLAGIGGHAFVSTGIIAGSFIFYQDRYLDWQKRITAERIRRARPLS